MAAKKGGKAKPATKPKPKPSRKAVAVCGYEGVWTKSGACETKTLPGGRCKDHAGRTCIECGGPAESTCRNWGSSLACGADVCLACRKMHEDAHSVSGGNAQPRKPGRPSRYNQETVDDICVRLIEGESLKAICRDESMPCISTVLKWLRENEEFSTQYARAKEEQAETLADEIVAIADEEHITSRTLKGENGDVEIVYDATAVARNRLRVDARKWVAAKLKPKKYGDKLQTELSGPDGGPIETRYSNHTDEQIDELIRQKAAAVGLKL